MATAVIYTLSLHDALPISGRGYPRCAPGAERDEAAHPSGSPSPRPADWRTTSCHPASSTRRAGRPRCTPPPARSEEHTSELQSRFDLVCRLLLEKKKDDAA